MNQTQCVFLVLAAQGRVWGITLLGSETFGSCSSTNWNLTDTVHTLWGLLEGLPKVDSLVVAELPMCHISMVTDDLPDMFRWHILLLRLYKPKLSFLTVTFGL